MHLSHLRFVEAESSNQTERGWRRVSSRAGSQFEGVALPWSDVQIEPVFGQVVAIAVIDGVAEQIAELP